MFSKSCSLVLSWLVVGALAVIPLATRTTLASVTKQEAQIAKHKKRIVEWGTNKNVSVKLNSGEKINGRIAEIQNDFFAVQSVTKDGKVSSQQINFSDIDKLAVKGNAGRVAGHTALGVLAGVGAIFVMLFVIYAATDS